MVSKVKRHVQASAPVLLEFLAPPECSEADFRLVPLAVYHVDDLCVVCMCMYTRFEENVPASKVNKENEP